MLLDGAIHQQNKDSRAPVLASIAVKAAGISAEAEVPGTEPGGLN